MYEEKVYEERGYEERVCKRADGTLCVAAFCSFSVSVSWPWMSLNVRVFQTFSPQRSRFKPCHGLPLCDCVCVADYIYLYVNLGLPGSSVDE